MKDIKCVGFESPEEVMLVGDCLLDWFSMITFSKEAGKWVPRTKKRLIITLSEPKAKIVIHETKTQIVLEKQ